MLEELGARQPAVSSELALAPDGCGIIERPQPKEPHCVPELLAQQLIEKCCGTHSLGLVYGFLLKAGLDEAEARAEFELFLSGTLSQKVLDVAAQWIEAERSRERGADFPAGVQGARTVKLKHPKDCDDSA